MNDSMSAGNLPIHRFSTRDIVIIVVSCVLVALAPSGQSFWIDEGTMGLISHSTQFFHQILLGKLNTSEVMMPLTTTYFYGLEKIVGNGEWALRLGNLPWLWFGIFCMGLIGKRIGWTWLPLLFALHPVVWFYADEIRPYSIQLAMGCWLTLGFVQLLQSEGTQVRGYLNYGFASALVIAASFLGIFVVAASGLILLIKAITGRWKPTRKIYAALGGIAVVNLAVVLVMLSLLHSGEGSRAWTLGVSNLIFAVYELLGFVGLGPGRELIRSSATAGGSTAAAELIGLSFFKLTILLAAYLAFAYAAFRASKDVSAKPALRLAFLSGSVAVLSVLCLLGASLASQFPFWGRHLAPTLPFLLLAVGCIASALGPVWTQRQQLYFVAPLFLVLLYSSCVIRWSPTHAKDDYRTASLLVHGYLADGKQVSWIAAPGPALYYQVPISSGWPPAPGTASIQLPAPDSSLHPDIIIVSKPDLYDHQRFLPAWAATPGVKVSTPCQSFVIYQFPSSL